MKDNLPYFSHDNDASQHPKMRALIAKYGYAGYGRFWVLNERIARSPDAFIDISRKVNKLDLAKELDLDENELKEFLDFLADPEIDIINICNGKLTTDRVTELFSKAIEGRKKDRNRRNKGGNFLGGDDILDFRSENPTVEGDFRSENPTEEEEDKIRQDQDKIKIRQDSCGSGEPPGKIPASKQKTDKPNKPDKPKKPPLREREPENDYERVELAYLRNWDELYRQKRVNTPDPITNWNQTRALLKKHFEKLKPELI